MPEAELTPGQTVGNIILLNRDGNMKARAMEQGREMVGKIRDQTGLSLSCCAMFLVPP